MSSMMNKDIKIRYVFQTADNAPFVEYFYLTEIEEGRFKIYVQPLNNTKIIAKNLCMGVLDINSRPIYADDILHLNWLSEVDDESAINIIESKKDSGFYRYHDEYYNDMQSAKKIILEELTSRLVFENGNFWLIREDNQRLFFYHKIKEWEVMVVGNIYENPELMPIEQNDHSIK